MAGRSHSQALKRAAHRIFAVAPAESQPDDSDELTESDVWGWSMEPAPPRQGEEQVRGRPAGPPAARGKRGPATSLPVNIPDWSKTLGGCADSCSGRRAGEGCGSKDTEDGDGGCGSKDTEDGDGGCGQMVPPHELLWGSRAASMSVHEGIGRTLKGRDLRRVRNAVWEITGFQD